MSELRRTREQTRLIIYLNWNCDDFPLGSLLKNYESAAERHKTSNDSLVTHYLVIS